jgi:autotransporter-associated beta strand protein
VTPGFPGFSAGGPFALTVGNNNQNTTYSGVLSGSGSLLKVGAGTLTLNGGNTYTGNTTVKAGTLKFAQATLAPSSTVSIANGAVLRLDFATTNAVAALLLNGVSQAAGVYSSANSSPYLAGSGFLRVSASNPTNVTFTVSGNTLALSWPSDHLGWTLYTNSVDVTATSQWYPLPGSSSVTSTNLTINPNQRNVFFRLQQHFLSDIQTVATNAIPITYSANGNTLNISWPADHTGWRLQTQTNGLSPTNWFDVPNANQTNMVYLPINPTNGSVLFRLVSP